MELGPVSQAEKAQHELEEERTRRRELEVKLESGYSFCHPEDDCKGQQAFLKVAGALQMLVAAATPIEEDGGSEEQRERFAEAFQKACAVLVDPMVDFDLQLPRHGLKRHGATLTWMAQMDDGEYVRVSDLEQLGLL